MLHDRRPKLAETQTMMSSPEELPDAQPWSGGVGADLRGARERLGWSLPAIATHLRIRLPFLEAIEDGRIGDLPGNAYAVGFVRTYAQSLGLDPDEIARRFRAEAAGINRKTELAFPAPVPERGVPAGAVVLLGAVIAIGAYVGWYRMSDRGPPASVVQPVPERLAPLAETVAPTPPPQAAAPAPAAVTPAAPSPTAAPGPATPASLAAVPPATSAAPAPTPAAPMQTAVVAPPPAPAVVSPTPGAPGADANRILLRATADAWVQVRDKTGDVLLNRVMRAGDSWPVPAKGQLMLTTGNAGGTQLLVDGVATASLGGDGAVRRDLPLDPDQIRDGKLAPPPKAPAVPKP